MNILKYYFLYDTLYIQVIVIKYFKRKGNKMKNKNFKQTDLSTLRLLLDFSKFSNNETVRMAYNILCLDVKGKAAYITKAVQHYDEAKGTSLQKMLFDIKQIDFIRRQYDICNVEALKELLSVKRSSTVYNSLLKKTPVENEPRKMLCGFSKDDKEAVKIHERLFKLSVNDRINLISQAVVRYVYDGYDPRAKAILAYTLLKNLIDEYQNSSGETKNIIANDVFAFMSISSDVQPIFKASINISSLSKEILALFIDEEEIKSYLGGQ